MTFNKFNALSVFVLELEMRNTGVICFLSCEMCPPFGEVCVEIMNLGRTTSKFTNMGKGDRKVQDNKNKLTLCPSAS